MRFSCRAVLTGYTKKDGTQAVAIRAIIDRKPKTIPLGFNIHPKYFDKARHCIKSNAPNADVYNLEINLAIGKASKIASDYRRDERYLSANDLIREYSSPINRQNFTDFFKSEIELRRVKLEPITYRQHKSVFNKLKAFQPSIVFSELTREFIQRFENFCITKYNNQGSTIKKNMRIINSYLHEAERKEIKFKNPFDQYALRTTDSVKPTLSIEELKKLFEYYYHPATRQVHKRILRYFLFSCTTGIRISDIMRIRWNDIHGDTLVYLPHKTRKGKRFISFPLTEVHHSLVPDTNDLSGEIFDSCAEQVTNRYLKKIAAECGIKKNLTYHISRHTFATEFLDRGGQLDTLQQLLGHSMITTTMRYARVHDGRKRTELTKVFDGVFPASANPTI